jgi:putative iron-regulated protein
MSFVKSTMGLVILGACLALGCGSSDDETSRVPENADDARLNYAEIVYASYQDSLELAQALDAAVQAFVAAPSALTFEAAREAWLASREPYLQTEVYRFYDGPIDDTVDGPEGQINAWPMDEVFVDYVEGDAAAGIINDPTVEISAASLVMLNASESEESITTGYHAVEFLLWGQDQSATGPGNRPHTDYVTDGTGTAQNQDRRGQYLTAASALLVDDLSSVASEWAPPPAANYRSEFVAASPGEALRRMLTGMTVLSGFETGGERLEAALDSGEQEDEHSCFSDNTHRDMVQDIQGVLNVWRGTYTRLDGSSVTGVGVRDVVAERDAALAQELDERIAESLRLANELVPPFDQEIRTDNAEGRARVQALIDSLREQARLFDEEVFPLFALEVPVIE